MKQTLIHYVLNQEQHHGKITFRDELIQLLDDNLVTYKEEYLMI